MTISQAKKICLSDYLEQRGIRPSKICGGKAWYRSPVRSLEKSESFIVNLAKNTWHDFGSGDHGDIIDLVSRLQNVSVKEALDLIGNGFLFLCHSFKYEIGDIPDDRGKIVIKRTQEVTHPALVNYILKRKVSLQYARTFLKEAYYHLYGKSYFALAFENDLGGYELRNERSKVGNSPKYFTTINGKDPSGINVFEGFMDFLSCCTFYRKIPVYQTIVLNSLSFMPRILPLLSVAEKVNLYLDNDEAGRKATDSIMSNCKRVRNWSQVLYPGNKDFNEFLMSPKL